MECVELETTESEKAYGTDKCPCGCHWSPDQPGSESEGGIVQNPHCIHCSVRVSYEHTLVDRRGNVWHFLRRAIKGWIISRLTASYFLLAKKLRSTCVLKAWDANPSCTDVLSFEHNFIFQFISGKVFIKDGKNLKPASVEYPDAASIQESRINASKKSAKTTTTRRQRLKSNSSSGQ